MPCVGSTSSCCDGLSGDRGREVKNVGDGLMVVFPSSSVAADVAVAMQQNVAHTTTPTGEALGLRVGIAVGDAEADELDYFGRPVVEAARLCGQPAAGRSTPPTSSRALAGGRGGHDFVSIGELTLKGLDGPVAASRILWSPTPALQDSRCRTAGARRRRPACTVATVSTNGSPGSSRSQAATAARSSSCRASRASGRRRCAGWWRAMCTPVGATVLYGRCDEGPAVPYQPWREALGGLVAGCLICA